MIEKLSYIYQESKYEIGIILDAFKNFINLKQRDDENLSSYLERFRAAADNLKTQLGGEIILTKYITTMDNYDETNKTTFIKTAYEEFKAYTFLVNSDNTKYGSLIKNLAQQQSLKNTQYPKTVTAASEVLLEHKWDDKYQEVKKKRKDNEKKKDEYNSTATTVSSNEDIKISFAQLENACYCCGKKGHSSNKC